MSKDNRDKLKCREIPLYIYIFSYQIAKTQKDRHNQSWAVCRIPEISVFYCWNCKLL